MRYRYILYPEAAEKLNSTGITDRVKKAYENHDISIMGFVSREDPKMTRRGLSPLLDKAFSMKVSEIAGPIKTANGYHIITVTQPAEQAPFEEVKMQVMFKIRGDAKNKILADLKTNSKVVYAEELKPQEAPAQQAPSAPEAPQGQDHPHGEGDGHQH